MVLNCYNDFDLIFYKKIISSVLETANWSGTGQGLTIAKDLVERQNGQLTITSEKNKVTTVSLIFPLLKVI